MLDKTNSFVNSTTVYYTLDILLILNKMILMTICCFRHTMNMQLEDTLQGILPLDDEFFVGGNQLEGDASGQDMSMVSMNEKQK